MPPEESNIAWPHGIKVRLQVETRLVLVVVEKSASTQDLVNDFGG
jgi:hypothetical protein